MTLKRTLLDLLEVDQLRDLCVEFDIEADRRSPDSMRDGLARAKRAKPERMIERMIVDQLRSALVVYEQPTEGKRQELVDRLLVAGGRSANSQEGSSEPPMVRELAPDPSLLASAQSQASQLLSAASAGNMGQYVHGDQAVQRPDVGVQDQFLVKKPPRTYRRGFRPC